MAQKTNPPLGVWASIGIFIANAFLIFGSAIAFIPQYIHIYATDNTSGFSIYVSLALVLASCIKFVYWFKLSYDTALFCQTITNILVMLTMLDLRVRILNRVRPPRDEERRGFLDCDPTYFWDWTDLLSYVQAIAIFIAAFAFITLVFGDFLGVMSTLGYGAAIIETAMTLPQLWANYSNKSTAGLSKNMVAIWILSDALKLGYLGTKDQIPMSFVVGAFLQLLVDAFIGLQILYYGDDEPNGGRGNGGDAPAAAAAPDGPDPNHGD